MHTKYVYVKLKLNFSFKHDAKLDYEYCGYDQK